MSLNPLNEIRFRHRLAAEHLERAERLFSLRDWVGSVSACQLAVENFAKAVIGVFEVPTWSHDPSNQLRGLIRMMPSDMAGEITELAAFVREMAPEHGRSSYGEPGAGLLPSDIYGEEHASKVLEKARKAKRMTEKILERLNVTL